MVCTYTSKQNAGLPHPIPTTTNQPNQQVASDIVDMKHKTLTYYRGNYDTFEAVRGEKAKNQRRLYEANLAKRAHMQDFIDKFRASRCAA